MSTSLVMFLTFIAITLGITFWASKRSAGSSAYFAAGRQIKGWQNGVAVAGDYMSAASFLGIAGLIAFLSAGNRAIRLPSALAARIAARRPAPVRQHTTLCPTDRRQSPRA